MIDLTGAQWRHQIGTIALFMGVMLSTDKEIARRMPVWTAMSQLFLDTQLDHGDLSRIAEALALSDYSGETLQEIFLHEVNPVLKANLLCVAGEWVAFDQDWLRSQLAPRLGQRRWYRRRVCSLVRDDWATVVATVNALRGGSPPNP